jgi:hypothetical protein
LSATNHILANRIVGHMNAFYVNHQGQRYFGIGAAYGKVCILSSPFGRFEDNVFHNNAGHAHPRLERPTSRSAPGLPLTFAAPL